MIFLDWGTMEKERFRKEDRKLISKKKEPQKTSESRDVFLSHSSKNKTFVRKLGNDVMSDKLGKQLHAWIDEGQIEKGQSITGAVEVGLSKSKFFAIIMTPEYFESKSGWTDAEWHAAIFDDPDNRNGKIIPIMAENCPKIPFLLRHLNTIDMRAANYKYGLKELIRVLRELPIPQPIPHRGQLISPGNNIDRASLVNQRTILAGQPDVVDERLYCNLLPIERLPKYVWTAAIAKSICRTRKDGSVTLPTKSDLRDYMLDQQALSKTKSIYSPAFRMHGNQIYTFHDIEESPLAFIADGDSIEKIETIDLLRDEGTRNVTISLMNMAIMRHAQRVGLVADFTKHNRYFFEKHSNTGSVIQWKPKVRLSKRQVVKPYVNKKDGRTLFWVHQAAYLKVIFLANKLYLQIRPTWVLTKDGIEILQGPKVSKVVNRYTGAERNLHVLYHVRFWTTILRLGSGPVTFRTGGQTIDFSNTPAFVEQSYGIADDRTNALEFLDQQAEIYARCEEDLIDRLPDVTTLPNTDDDEDIDYDDDN